MKLEGEGVASVGIRQPVDPRRQRGFITVRVIVCLLVLCLLIAVVVLLLRPLPDGPGNSHGIVQNEVRRRACVK